MKSVRLNTLILMILFTFIINFNTSQAVELEDNVYMYMSINSTKVSFRDGPSTNSKVKGYIIDGTVVTLLEQDKYWSKVEYNNEVGYVSTKYLEPANVYKVVKGTSVAIRNKPSTSGNLIKRLKTNQEVKVLGKKGSWSYIEVDGTRGYLSSKYLDDKKELKIITGLSVNFRETASSSGRIISKLTYDTEVYELSSTELWSHIEYNGVRGYVSSKYIDYKKEIKFISGSSVALREEPSTKGKLISRLTKGTKIYVLKTYDKWSYVEYNNNRGYVSNSYIIDKTPIKYVDSLALNFRESPSSTGKLLTKISYGEEVEFYEEIGSWSKVKYNNNIGYVSSKYICDELDTQPKYNLEIASAISNFRSNPYENSDLIKELRYKQKVEFVCYIGSWAKVYYNGVLGYISKNNLRDISEEKPIEIENITARMLINAAKQNLGKPYVWSTEGPESFDCSGFTRYLYKTIAGIQLPRESIDQSKSPLGKDVDLYNLQPGDLLFFDTEGNKLVNHVGMYIGNGEFIHASQKFEEVIISPVEGFYLNGFISAKRFLN